MKIDLAINDYDNAAVPSRKKAVKLANGYLQERIFNGSKPQIIFDHGVHIYNVAKIAEKIAEKTNGALNPNTAYVLGLLHDIGRIKDETVTKVPHSIEGYNYLHQKGHGDIAAICLTHCFIDKNIQRPDYPTFSDEQFYQTKNFLRSIKYNDYDHLIQIADLFSRGREIMSIRQRLDRNKSFYKISKLSYENKAFRLRDYLDKKYNIDIEQIVADTFNLKKHIPQNHNGFIFIIQTNRLSQAVR